MSLFEQIALIFYVIQLLLMIVNIFITISLWSGGDK